MSQNPFEIIFKISQLKDKRSKYLFNQLTLSKNIFNMSALVREATEHLDQLKKKV